MSKLTKRKKKNKEIGTKYNVYAWQHFGKTKKLKGGFTFDDDPTEVEGTMKMKGRRHMKKKKQNNRQYGVLFKEKGLFKRYKNIRIDPDATI